MEAPSRFAPTTPLRSKLATFQMELSTRRRTSLVSITQKMISNIEIKFTVDASSAGVGNLEVAVNDGVSYNTFGDKIHILNNCFRKFHQWPMDWGSTSTTYRLSHRKILTTQFRYVSTTNPFLARHFFAEWALTNRLPPVQDLSV